MMKEMNNRLMRDLPKVDLHCHLDGSIRTPTILDLAKRQNYDLPAETVEGLRPFVRVPLGCRSLGDFLKRFEVFYPLLRDAYALERIAYELCRDCAAENVKYLEIRFAPVLQKRDGFPIPEVVEAVLRGIERGQKDYPIEGGLILCLYRGVDMEDNMETARCAVKMKDSGVCGIDIAGDESRYPVEAFEEPVALCRKAGVSITIHAGEAAGPESIRSAVNMGADRIGHGVSLIKNPQLMREIADRQIPLEICLTSNVHTQVVPDYEHHPVREFIKNGVNVTLNTDDRGVSGIDLSYEYFKATEIGISLEQLANIINNGVEASFTEDKFKDELRSRVNNELAGYLK